MSHDKNTVAFFSKSQLGRQFDYPFVNRHKALLHFHGSHHGSSRILIRVFRRATPRFLLDAGVDTFELGVYTGKYGVSTDRQGSNADHAGNAYGAKHGFQGRARRLLGTFTVLTRRCTLSIGISPEC